ncbi:hypothetical protein AB0K00_34040 [Dactylosporangium sp. NPDC049525]|uniref:hypothetical protein n=1 Tax=Dactylosporangium sp. NPDC049525 TaxID=3154730 RepID=UPI00342568E0
MSISGAKTTSDTPAITSTLYVAAAGWVIAAFFLGTATWQSASEFGDAQPNNAPALTIIVLCLIGATVSLAGGAIVRLLAKQTVEDRES